MIKGGNLGTRPVAHHQAPLRLEAEPTVQAPHAQPADHQMACAPQRTACIVT